MVDRSYISVPHGASATTPSVVLCMHLTGVDRMMRAAADRFAEAGFACAVPDLYADIDAPDGDVETDLRQFIPLARSLQSDTISTRLNRAADELRTRFPRGNVGIAGFCMGGVMATYRAVRRRCNVDAVATWYGLSEDVAPEDVDVPIVGSFGALDHGIAVDRVNAFVERLNVDHDIEVYPGVDHGFCADAWPAFNAVACEGSWARTLSFLRRHLSKEP